MKLRFKMNKKNIPEIDYISYNLKKIIKILNLSQLELSKKTGLSQASISGILSKSRVPDLSSLILILKVIPIKFESLMNKPKDEK